MDDQRPGIADIGEMGDDLQAFDEGDPGLVAALDAEGEDRTGALRAEPLLGGVVGMVGKARIFDPVDLRMRLQVLGDGQRVVAVALHAQRQRLDAGQDHEGVHRRDRRAEIAQAEHPAGDGEGEIAEGLVQDDAGIFVARLRQHRELVGGRPVEGAAIDDDGRPSNCRDRRGTWSASG